MSRVKQIGMDEESEIYPYCLHARVNKVKKEKQAEIKEEILSNCKIVATTCMNSACEDISNLTFSFLVIDEASQVCSLVSECYHRFSLFIIGMRA